MGALRQIHPVILAGGSGVRLWPLSRRVRPKPFLHLTGEQTFFQMTLARVADTQRFAPPLVICGKSHRFLVAEQLHQLVPSAPRIVLEPASRNTAPAACIAALLIAEQDPEGLLLLLPSDHYIGDQPGFRQAVDAAAEAAADGWLATFGARPDSPETGYGYIERGAPVEGDGATVFRVARFVEKPDLETARRYLDDGGYSWNSGMFLLPAKLLLEEMETFAPEILAACRASLAGADQDADFLRLEEASFARQPDLSFDYAVMEHTARSAVIPIDIGWSDVGSWDALYQIAGKDADGNVLTGDVIAVECRNSYLRSEGAAIAALGVDDIAVIATRDALLVCPRARAQDVSRLIDRLKDDPVHAALTQAEGSPAASQEGVDK